eukprot:gnl/MRDRNA2_/MRDRNA2_142847_c0_seq1.p1 gnl/MRDRNA2_/MRDRNA2_142847_c0~~gnl/MRDRNA2_/MRDRNA2_142847_c0_seq1.p1  ORF type:complete len:548 (-),score=92.05 gnl/MRDRNA2_/MRDRNA2_142847_c0_seq1:620-2104(-)
MTHRIPHNKRGSTFPSLFRTSQFLAPGISVSIPHSRLWIRCPVPDKAVQSEPDRTGQSEAQELQESIAAFKQLVAEEPLQSQGFKSKISEALGAVVVAAARTSVVQAEKARAKEAEFASRLQGYSSAEKQRNKQRDLSRSFRGSQRKSRQRLGNTRRNRSESDGQRERRRNSITNQSAISNISKSEGVCFAACIASQCDLGQLTKALLKGHVSSKRFGMSMKMIEMFLDKDALQLEINGPDGPTDAFIFPFGCFVCWGCSRTEFELAKDLLMPFTRPKLPKSQMQYVEEDSMGFVHETVKDSGEDSNGSGRETGDSKSENPAEDAVRDDKIYLMTTSHAEKLAHSYALAQSVKLGVFEEAVDESIDKARKIPKTMARTGRVEMSAKSIAMRMGELLELRCDVNLQTDILDTPEIFWDEAEFEQHYQAGRLYLDVDKRVDILNTRLEILRDLFDILQDAHNTRHGTKLEWIIIILVGIEVILGLVGLARSTLGLP